MAAGKKVRVTLPIVIMAHGFYTFDAAVSVLGISPRCLPREIALGRLRYTKRANRYFFLGEWLIEWLKGGERKSTRTDAHFTPYESKPAA